MLGIERRASPSLDSRLYRDRAFAQAMPTDNPAAAANVRQSEQYTAALRSNPAFRKRREAIECGPIADPQLRQSCISSFEAYASGPQKSGR